MQGSRFWATVILTLAAAGLWVLSIWVETRWPWLPFDEGGPWPLASSPAWKRAWAIWVVYVEYLSASQQRSAIGHFGENQGGVP